MVDPPLQHEDPQIPISTTRRSKYTNTDVWQASRRLYIPFMKEETMMVMSGVRDVGVAAIAQQLPGAVESSKTDRKDWVMERADQQTTLLFTVTLPATR